MKHGRRKMVWDELLKHCYLAKKNDHIEVTEWTNGEGWDITINDRLFTLTSGELSAINYLTKALEVGEDKEGAE